MTSTTRTDQLDRMLAGLGVRPRILDVDGVRTRLIEMGDGSPLVLLHGAIECGGALWAPVLPQLAARHRVLVPDLPGLGGSDPVDRLDATRFHRWFVDLLRTTGTAEPTVVAHSLAGSLSARAAIQWRRLVRHLVVYGGPAIGAYRMPSRLRYLAIRFAIRPTARNAERFDRFALLDLDACRRRDPAWFHAFEACNLSQARVPHVKRTMSQLIRTGTGPIPDAELARIEVPVSLLWGRHDRMVPLSIGEAASARHGWPLHIVDGAAHVPHIEDPISFVDTLHSLARAS
ncbi:MAG TPA: alpha/beta hydrolase [Micromonosporaceae bacterium]